MISSINKCIERILPGTLYWYDDEVIMYISTKPKESSLDKKKYQHTFLLSDGDVGWGYSKSLNFEQELVDLKRIEL